LSIDPNQLKPGHRTWILFLIFAIVNAVLTFFPMPSAVRLLLLAAGIIFPCVWAVGKAPSYFLSFSPFENQEFLPPISLGWWILLGMAALFLRFYKLENLFALPVSDEGLFSFFAIGLSEKWNWNFFYATCQNSPLLVWAMSFFYRLFDSTFYNLRIFPALASLAALPFFYCALRRAYSRSFAFLGLAAAAFNLWLWGCGRWCQPGVVLPAWEMICLLLMIGFTREDNPAKKTRLAAFLGFAAGLGPYTFPIWPFPVLTMALGAFGASFSKISKNRRYIFWFSIFFLTAFAPYFIASHAQAYDPWARIKYGLGEGVSWKDRGLASFSFLSSLFWGPWEGVRVWDGDNLERFNPLAGAALLLGIVQMIRLRSRKEVQWILLGLSICFFPALISIYVETFRILPVLPFLILAAAWGWGTLLTAVPLEKRLVLSLLFLLLSVGLDGRRVLSLHGNEPGLAGTSATGASLFNLMVYKTLKEQSNRLGPGLILTEFTQDLDEVPFVSTYDFNAAENPRRAGTAAKWAGFLTNVHYRPFLSARFPGVQWVRLEPEAPQEDEVCLAIIPVSGENQLTLENWVLAHHRFRRLNGLFNNAGGSRSYGLAEKALDEELPMLKNDPFLQSCYWELRSEFYYRFNFKGHYDDMVFDLRQAVERGYPSAHLYYKLGSLLMRRSRFGEARQSLQKALAQEPDFQPARDALLLLGGLEKKSNQDQTSK